MAQKKLRERLFKETWGNVAEKIAQNRYVNNRQSARQSQSAVIGPWECSELTLPVLATVVCFCVVGENSEVTI